MLRGTVFLLMTVNLYLSAQNLVSNFSFEDLSGTVVTSGQLELAVPWKIDSQSPDLFNTNATVRFLAPPIFTACDTILPKTGNSFVGFAGFGPSTRGIFSTYLLRPISPGTEYYVAILLSIEVTDTKTTNFHF